jgi:hypothetical protein
MHRPCRFPGDTVLRVNGFQPWQQQEAEQSAEGKGESTLYRNMTAPTT